MKKTNCIIIEDDEAAQIILKHYIEQENKLNLISIASNSQEAIKTIEQSKIDLIFLDINLPGKNGFHIIENISYTPQIIFTTANKDFAIKSFNYNVVDYLLKPINEERFFKSINKLFKVNNDSKNSTPHIQNYILHMLIHLKNGTKNLTLNTSEIKYIESYGNYAKIHLNNEIKLIKITIKELISLLPSTKFIQPHKSYIVNIDYIKYVSSNEIQVEDIKIPIGICYKKYVQNIFSSQDNNSNIKNILT